MGELFTCSSPSDSAIGDCWLRDGGEPPSAFAADVGTASWSVRLDSNINLLRDRRRSTTTAVPAAAAARVQTTTVVTLGSPTVLAVGVAVAGTVRETAWTLTATCLAHSEWIVLSPSGPVDIPSATVCARMRASLALRAFIRNSTASAPSRTARDPILNTLTRDRRTPALAAITLSNSPRV